MALKWIPTNPDDLVRDYLSGVSIKALAAREGVTRPTVTKLLRAAGVAIRTISEQELIRAASKTPEERKAYTKAAHNAVRGRKVPPEESFKRALAKEGRVGASPYEQVVWPWLEPLGFIPQKAIGPYNIDFASSTIAVEVFGGHFHSYGQHAVLHPKRMEAIRDSGRLSVTCWISTRKPLTDHLRHYLVALVEGTESNPPPRGEHRVVWGSGEDVTLLCPNFDKIPAVPPLHGGVSCVCGNAD